MAWHAIGHLREAAFVALAATTLLSSMGCDVGRDAPDVLPSEVGEIVQQLYDRARDAGDEVPADVVEWAREDVGRIGDWEYRVLRLRDDETLEAELNALGAERWEVFWIRPAEAGFRLFLKRSARSYLRLVPLGELGRLAPGAGE